MPRFVTKENVRACVIAALGAKAARKKLWIMRTGPSTIQLGFLGDDTGVTIDRATARAHNTTPAEIIRELKRAARHLNLDADANADTDAAAS